MIDNGLRLETLVNQSTEKIQNKSELKFYFYISNQDIRRVIKFSNNFFPLFFVA